MSELYHYGIQGQKWGVRRYQNEDGSLTAEGIERYSVSSKRGKMAMKDLYKVQTKAGKKFDKHTEKILKDKAAGKKISDRRIKKAIELGAQYRLQDYHAKNIDEYTKYYNDIDSSTGRVHGIGTTARVANNFRLMNKRVKGGNIYNSIDGLSVALSYVLPNIAAYSTAKIVKKSSPYNKKGQEFAEKAKKETIADLKKHGIMDKNSKLTSNNKIFKMTTKKERQARNGLIFAGTVAATAVGIKAANEIMSANAYKKTAGIKPKGYYDKVIDGDNYKVLKDLGLRDIGYDAEWMSDWQKERR